jgi:hypothetical protein
MPQLQLPAVSVEVAGPIMLVERRRLAQAAGESTGVGEVQTHSGGRRCGVGVLPKAPLGQHRWIGGFRPVRPCTVGCSSRPVPPRVHGPQRMRELRRHDSLRAGEGHGQRQRQGQGDLAIRLLPVAARSTRYARSFQRLQCLDDLVKAGPQTMPTRQLQRPGSSEPSRLGGQRPMDDAVANSPRETPNDMHALLVFA